SAGAGAWRSGCALRPRPRALPLAPFPALPPARHPSRVAPGAAASALAAGFLRPLSSDHEDDTSDALMVFLTSPGTALTSFLAPFAAAGLCKVPERLPASGSGAFRTLRGRLSISRRAAA